MRRRRSQRSIRARIIEGETTRSVDELGSSVRAYGFGVPLACFFLTLFSLQSITNPYNSFPRPQIALAYSEYA